ncbi:MAG: hypothetical protein ACD_78C00144G0001 [uncultured bacterium (gcode 4)]|uniref:Uncharacterized protein n=1 Tax=uncultured bacterium (gcode 4) TaxID=1234023 RepID=K1YD32_9BACT|nr:MAG: hypothetical protein ACD_78C00144G0001 [uncultured bacterium (gcode 4)]
MSILNFERNFHSFLKRIESINLIYTSWEVKEKIFVSISWSNKTKTLLFLLYLNNSVHIKKCKKNIKTM